MRGVRPQSVGRLLRGGLVRCIYSSEQDYGGENVFLYDVTAEQLLFNDRFSIKPGRFSASDNFNASPIYSPYMNHGIDGDMRNILFDTQSSAYPFATWASRVVYYPVKEVALKLGVFQAESDVFDRRYNGLDWSIDHQDGVFLIGEIDWSPEFFKRPAPAKADGTDGGKAVVNLVGDIAGADAVATTRVALFSRVSLRFTGRFANLHHGRGAGSRELRG